MIYFQLAMFLIIFFLFPQGNVKTSSIQALLMLPSLSLQQQTLARRRFPIYYKYIL